MLSRAQREEGMKQIKEIRRRLRENDWDEVNNFAGHVWWHELSESDWWGCPL